MIKTTLLVIATLVLGMSRSEAQVHETVRSLFEAGAYANVTSTVTALTEQGVATADDSYVEAQALVKLGQADRARQVLARLATSPVPHWQQIAASEGSLIDQDLAGASAAAEQAVAGAPDQLLAQYQLGLVRAEQQEWTGAAAAFDRAAQIDPAFAYAHYYAGLAYSKIKRVDRTAREFEIFLKLAPQAPERPAVESIMRTIRGR